MMTIITTVTKAAKEWGHFFVCGCLVFNIINAAELPEISSLQHNYPIISGEWILREL